MAVNFENDDGSLVACWRCGGGRLCLYTHAALEVVARSLAVCAPLPEVEAFELKHDGHVAYLFEGFSAASWALYSKKKAGIASRVCKLAGQLKARCAAWRSSLL